MKKKIISLVALILCLSAVFCSCSKVPEDVDSRIDKVVSETLIKKIGNNSDFAECKAEGHIILGYEKKSNGYLVYTITRTAIYGFENGNLVVVKGSLTKPAVIELTNKFELKKIRYAKENSNYDFSINELFPESYYERLKPVSITDEQELDRQLDSYALKYLESIGRQAEVGKMEDFKSQYPKMEDYAIVPSVYNKIFENKLVEKYPYWQGNREAIEDGVRVVYTTEFQMTDGRIKYTKTNYETNEVLELYYFSVTTGEELK